MSINILYYFIIYIYLIISSIAFYIIMPIFVTIVSYIIDPIL